MFAMTIRYFSIIFYSIYCYFKITNTKPRHSQHYILALIISFAASLFFTSLFSNSFFLRILFSFIFIFAYIITNSNELLYRKFIASLAAFSTSYITLSLASFILSVLLAPTSINIFEIPEIYYILLSSIIQSILIFFLFKINRLKNGMPFLLKNNMPTYILTSYIIIILGIILICGIKTTNFNKQLNSLLFMLFLAIALLIWWRRKLTQSYVEKLRVSEVETLYKEISDRDLEIEKLHAHNEELGQIIHKDNKLIPAMELAVRSYLQTAALMEPEKAKQMGTELLAKLERMSADRAGIVKTYKENNTFRQRTGVSSIDAIVDFMENKASNLGIEYKYQFDKGIKEKLCAYISEDDFMHLLSEINDNAIIAASYSEKKDIHVHIGFIQNMLYIDILDSGIPFTPETYQNFGTLQHTTHGDHGGSGIGLMDLAKLKKQYKFSLQIYEYPPDESIYTKKIRLLFDKKNHYLIQSYRAREIRSTVMRNDLHVLQYVETEKITTLLEEKSKQA